MTLATRFAAIKRFRCLGDDSAALVNRFQIEFQERGSLQEVYAQLLGSSRIKAADRQRELRVLFENVMDSWGMVKAMLNSPNFSFDWHGRLILHGFKYSMLYPLRGVWHPFSRETGS